MADIGLKSVMEMTGFTQGINKYNDMVGGASSKTEKHASIMSKALAGIGTAVKMGTAVAAAGIATLVAGITTAALASVSWAEKLDSVGDVLGTTAEESAALAVAAQHIGGNVEQLSSQMAILTRGLEDAKGEIGPTGKVLKELGISFKDANGKMLPTTDILQKVADKLGKMPDGLEKTQLMMDLFGKSGKDMSDMLGVLADGGMEEFNQKAKDMGLSMSDDAVAGAIDFNRSLNDLKMGFQGFLVQLGTEFMPMMQGVANFLGDVLPIALNFLHGIFAKIQPTIELVTGAFAELLYQLASGGDPINAISVAIMRLFGMDAALKFLEITDAVKGFVSSAVEFLLPILQQVGDFIQTQVIPRVETLITWFQTNLPVAMAAISDFWTNTLLPAIKNIVLWLGKNVPEAAKTLTDFWNNKLLPAIQDFATWVQANWEPLAAGIAAALLTVVIPALITWIATQYAVVAAHVAVAAAAIAAYAPVIAIMAVVGAAVFALYKAWDTNFMGIRTTLTTFWNDSVKPAFEDIKEWLSVAIPKAIDWCKIAFDKLKIAFNDIWAYIQDPLLPIFKDIITWLEETIKNAVETFANDIWPKIKTAFEKVKNFIEDPLIPTLKTIIDWLETTIKNTIETFKTTWAGLKEAFKTVSDWIDTNLTGPNGMFTKVVNFLSTGFDTAVNTAKGVLSGITGAFNGIKEAVQWVLDKLNVFIELIKSVKIPAWLHLSPGLVEQGLMNISSAFTQATMDARLFGRTLDNIVSPSVGINASYNAEPIRGGAGIAGGSNIYNNNRALNLTMNPTINSGMDFAMFKTEVLSVVMEALG